MTLSHLHGLVIPAYYGDYALAGCARKRARAGAHDCKGIILKSSDLEAALDQALEEWGRLVSDASAHASRQLECYLQVRIVVRVWALTLAVRLMGGKALHH